MIRPQHYFSRQVAGLVLATCFSLSAANPKIEWRGNREVAVTGLTPAQIAQLRDAPTDWFSVRMDIGLPWEETPFLSGSRRVRSGEYVFRPEFAFGPGTKFVARFQMPGMTGFIRSRFEVPKTTGKPRATVAAVYPSADVLPENLLKFYLHFSHPMSRGDVYRHITLLDEKELPVELPFLEIGEELWDPEQKRLTLLIDPGRIKRGVKPLEDIGPAIEKGKRYTLHISRAWQDGRGIPMVREFRKSFKVVGPDRTPVSPLEWRIITPPPNTRKSLTVVFPEALDHALASRVIWIEDKEGKAIEGEVRLSSQETRWQLTPKRPWASGHHHLRAKVILEDLAGNSIGKPFEVDVFERVDDGISLPTFGRQFSIGSE